MRNNKLKFATIVVAFAASCAILPTSSLHAQSNEANRKALLAADRAFAKSAEGGDVIEAIAGMMSDSVTLIALGDLFHGIPKVREALSRNSDNVKSKYSWSPLYGEVSADGKTGFTLGFTMLKKSDNSEVPGKYVAYWTKGASGWKVLVYKRTARAAGDVSMTEEPGPKTVASAAKFTSVDSTRFAAELDKTERDFSTLSAKIGLGAAFTQNSAVDGHHSGGAGDAGFRHGPADIGAGISSGGEPPLGSFSWGPDVVYVAGSGDIGITLGFINIAGADGKPPRKTSYLTVWKRASVKDPWKLAIE
ncbi:MAG: hypothetical protein ABJB66_12740 [Gemmatimonadaceae bacterium]